MGLVVLLLFVLGFGVCGGFVGFVGVIYGVCVCLFWFVGFCCGVWVLGFWGFSGAFVGVYCFVFGGFSSLYVTMGVCLGFCLGFVWVLFLLGQTCLVRCRVLGVGFGVWGFGVRFLFWVCVGGGFYFCEVGYGGFLWFSVGGCGCLISDFGFRQGWVTCLFLRGVCFLLYWLLFGCVFVFGLGSVGGYLLVFFLGFWLLCVGVSVSLVCCFSGLARLLVVLCVLLFGFEGVFVV